MSKRSHTNDPSERDQPASSRQLTRRSINTAHVFLGVLATVCVLAGLKQAASVALPLVAALFLMALLWPVQRGLERYVSRGWAALGSLLALLAIFGALGAGLWYSGSVVSTKGPVYAEKLTESANQLREWAKEQGLPISGGNAAGDLKQAAKRLGSVTTSALGGFVLVLAFFVLGLIEVRDYRRRLELGLASQRARHWADVIGRVARDFQRYLAVRTVIGLMTGVGAGVAAWLIGLDFPFIWGLANFLLNYIPTLGSIIGVLPPTLFGFAQEGVSTGVLALVSIGGIQLIMGNYIDPLLQGRALRLSPLVVLLSVTFWGWMWGVVGALIGVPITIAVVLVCREFDATRWLALMLSAPEEIDGKARPSEQAVASPRVHSAEAGAE